MKNVFDIADTVEINGNCEEHGLWSYHVPPVLAKRGGICPDCVEVQKQRSVDDYNSKKHNEDLKRKQEQVRNNFEKAAIPKRYLNRTFENYKVLTQQHQLALSVTKHYANKFSERLESGGGLILQGKPGTGKTHLACAVANTVVANGSTARFITVMQLVRLVRSTWKRDSEKSEDDILKAVIGYDLLIIDEIGVQYETESEKLILFDVLNGRYENVKPTILLTNLVGEELNACIGERNVDRIQEGGGTTISFTWGSYRSSVYDDASLKSESCAEIAASKVGVA
jgi:DNA replication protein DnaC